MRLYNGNQFQTPIFIIKARSFLLMFHSYTDLTSPITFQLLEVPSANPYNDLILSFLHQQSQLIQEVQQLRASLDELKKQSQLIAETSKERKSEQRSEEAEKSGHQGYKFKKDRSCPTPGCSRKYSSNIALRAHLRKKHAKPKPSQADLNE